MAPYPSELFPRLQQCHVTAAGTLPPFRHASITGFRASPHSVGSLREAVDLRVLLHNRVRCRGLAFPPDRCPMLPWASAPRQGSPAIPCSRPKKAAWQSRVPAAPKGSGGSTSLPGERPLWLRFTSGGRDLLSTPPSWLVFYPEAVRQPERRCGRSWSVEFASLVTPGRLKNQPKQVLSLPYRKVALCSMLPALPHSKRLLSLSGAGAFGKTTSRNAETR
jgi:hypothetical protein